MRVWFASLIAVLTGVGAAQAQSGLCADPGAYCSAALSKKCLERRGAGAVGAEASGCSAQIEAYGACISRAATECGARRSDPGRVEEAKAAFDAVADSKNPSELEIVAAAYPDTIWGKLAAARAKALRASATSTRGETAGAAASEGEAAAAAADVEAEKALIRAMQTALKKKCFYRGGIDGDWGAGSKAALAAFVRKAKSGGIALDAAGLDAVRRASVENCAAAPRRSARRRITCHTIVRGGVNRNGVLHLNQEIGRARWDFAIVGDKIAGGVTREWVSVTPDLDDVLHGPAGAAPGVRESLRRVQYSAKQGLVIASDPAGRSVVIFLEGGRISVGSTPSAIYSDAGRCRATPY